MKSYIFIFILTFMFQNCKKVTSEPSSNTGLVGKWSFSYEIQNKNADGNWGQWTTINTLVAVPIMEFTIDGKILYNGKIVKECCTYSSYLVKENTIFANKDLSGLDCSLVKCGLLPEWKIFILNKEILELELPYQRTRYFRAK